MTPADKPDLPAPDDIDYRMGKDDVHWYHADTVRRLLADERRKARAELIAEMRAKPVYWYDPDTPLAIVPEK